MEAPAAPFKDVPDPELRAQIEEREVLLKKRHRRQSLAVTFGIFDTFASCIPTAGSAATTGSMPYQMSNGM